MPEVRARDHNACRPKPVLAWVICETMRASAAVVLAAVRHSGQPFLDRSAFGQHPRARQDLRWQRLRPTIIQQHSVLTHWRGSAFVEDFAGGQLLTAQFALLRDFCGAAWHVPALRRAGLFGNTVNRFITSSHRGTMLAACASAASVRPLGCSRFGIIRSPNRSLAVTFVFLDVAQLKQRHGVRDGRGSVLRPGARLRISGFAGSGGKSVQYLPTGRCRTTREAVRE